VGDVCGVGDPVLPHFDAKIANTIRFAVSVHRRIEDFARVRKLIADANPFGFEHRDRDPRRAIIIVVKDANIPGASFTGRRGKPRCKTMQ
jgi:hypothetical protein